MPRPYVLLSAAVSIDGHLDTRPGEDRLLLSNKQDFEPCGSAPRPAGHLADAAGSQDPVGGSSCFLRCRIGYPVPGRGRPSRKS